MGERVEQRVDAERVAGHRHLVEVLRVVRLALENAVSVAGVLLLTEATMTEVPEPKTEVAPLDAA